MIYVLQMLEFVVGNPFNSPLSEAQASAVSSCIDDLCSQMDGQPVLARRIKKIWSRREHLLDMARYVHKHHEDYMDSLEYHQEIQWIRTYRRMLSNRLEADG